ncbi:hypothetical protein POTOM_042073 [Populus tomentosa]|uniref:Uncharacterized protein n=1 Tax=Populus tomentosa TaxID=118781 RepID=A0A8X7YQ93_POPTO|nr:hypothetical protein POTOM_042073 [Populus tomentosa]
MATALATVVNGLGLFVSVFWGLREQRFLAIFEAVTSAVTCMTMSLTVCFLAIHRHARVEAELKALQVEKIELHKKRGRGLWDQTQRK